MKHRLFGTLPGRAIVIGLAAKVIVLVAARLAGTLPPLLGVVDTVAGLAMGAGAIYFAVRWIADAKRRLLWRVRRKLILSYIFIGFVPALLIAAFFLLGGLLLFFNFSSYLVQTELQRIQDRARYVASTTGIELRRVPLRDVPVALARRQQAVEARFPGASLAVVPLDRECARTPAPGRPSVERMPVVAGSWAHVEPPRTIPDWIGCEGFTGLMAFTRASAGVAADTQMLVRAVVFEESPMPGYAVVVDLPVSDQVKRQLRRDTGVELRGIAAVSMNGELNVGPMAGRAGAGASGPAPAAGVLSWVTILDDRSWSTGAAGTLVVSTELSIAEMYDRIARAQGLVGNRSFGQTLLVLLLVIVGGLFLIIEGVALIVGLALAKSITGSVHELFVGTERVRHGDFTHKIAVKAADQLGELAGSFNSMTASIEDLLRQAAEKKRLEEELRIAHEIQMSLLPQGPLVMAGLSVAALCVPAREVGGDYYDFLPLDDHRVGVLIADVSGKGTSAALYMAELKGLMLSLSRIHTSPRELLITANRIIAEHLDTRSFITMTYAVIDVRARTMTYARAGHTPLIFVPGPDADRERDGGGDRRARILAPDGMVLGLQLDNGEMFERLLDERVMPLGPGDVCLFFTDGISEAMNVADDCFGDERLGALIEQHADLGVEDLRARVLEDVEAFVGGAPQHDDMTMILLKMDPQVIHNSQVDRIEAVTRGV